MAKRDGKQAAGEVLRYPELLKRRHPRLFLAKLLEDEAFRFHKQGDLQFENASEILRHWAELAEAGHLGQKETSLDADFLQKIFGDALGYKSVSESPNEYHRERQYTVTGAGTADGALGNFVSGKQVAPTAIIELKGADTDLDHDKFNGRTPVQQCWDYLNQLPDTLWGIVSNYVTIRLYHRGSPARAYEEFTVADFKDESRVKQFYYVFERHGLLGNKLTEPRALKLLKGSARQQKEVGDALYGYYADQRSYLIETLMQEKSFTQDQAIFAAQRLLDRIIFIAFCEDRGLLPQNLIENTWRSVAPLELATNPRWRRFLETFRAIDTGHPNLDLPTGYNGGLFRKSDLIDDLQLEDRWAEVFRNIGNYDFREGGDINVDVLGHIFERSISELEKLRVVGLFGKQAEAAQAQMPKSAERKRFGIYYTPPEFTRLIIDNTLGKVIEQRVEPLEDLNEKARVLRSLTICDPACGSGAFLIAAYDKLEEAYEGVIRQMRRAELNTDADTLERNYPDYILHENLYGVDLSEQSVEITQLALWLRSARKGTPLSDLSKNIVCGNSLVRDGNVHEKALVWQDSFPQIFKTARRGFDCVVGNPPWERMKLQEREFFSLGAPKIAAAVNAAQRRKLVAALQSDEPELWKRYEQAQATASKTLDYVRTCGHFPLTGKGDVNTYMVFVELARQIVAPTGRAGVLVPSGIATDDTTKEFFNSLVHTQSLIALFDFENKLPVFPDVHRSFKFCVLLFGGTEVKTPDVDFVFFAHQIEDLNERSRHIELSEKDLKLLNPNTRTCPILRSKRDADLTRKVYRRVPILIDHNRKEGGNPWGLKLARIFDQDNASESFTTAKQLKDDGFRLEGNRWIKRKEVYLPLYEAKMIQSYDHRAAGVVIDESNWMRKAQTEETSLVEHQNPEFLPLPVYWVREEDVREHMGEHVYPAYLAWKKVTSPTNQRTMIAAFVPWAAFIDSMPVMLHTNGLSARQKCCLLANLNSLAYDFIARQKVGGLHLNFFIVEQLPTLPPDRYAQECPWDSKTTLEKWISERVLKLTCTANDMIPLAEAAKFTPKVYRWNEDERAKLMAELDAAYFILYGLKRADVEYILGTFQGVAKEDESHGGEGPTRKAILAALDELGGG